MQTRISTGWWVGLLWAVTIWAGAAEPPDPEVRQQNKIKVTSLFNFTQFVDWPAPTFPSATAPFVIGVIGKDPFGDLLEEVVKGETVKHRPLAIRRCQRVADIEGCHILFISASEKPKLKSLLAALRRRPILTVSDLDQFAGNCGMIGFVRKGNRVGLEINKAEVDRADLKVDSRLLGLASIVTCDKQEGD